METLSFDVIERLDNLVIRRLTDRGGRAETLPGGGMVRRYGDKLTLSMDRQGDCIPGSRAREGVDSSSGHGLTPAATRQSRRLRRPNSSVESVRAFSVRLAVPGQTRLPGQGGRITARIGPGIVKERAASVGALPARASLSLRVWRKRCLLARSWKPGDRMRPFGLKGTKKLQDIFSDGKVPPTLRHRLPIIECQGEIVWIPGFRIAQGWEVRPDEASALQLAMEPWTMALSPRK